MTPSRSAHGQISSSRRSKRSITASATSAPATTGATGSAETPGSVGAARRSTSRAASGGVSRSAVVRQHAADERPSSDGAAPQIRASERNVFEVATAWSGAAARSTAPGVARDLGADPLAQARGPCRRRSPSAQPLAGQPAGAERERLRDVGRLVGARRDLERAAADVEDQPAGPTTSRTSGVRRGRSAAPRPHRGAPRARPRSRRGPASSTSSALVASRTAEVAKPSISSQPLSSATSSADATNVDQRVDARVVDSARRRRGARPAAAAP